MFSNIYNIIIIIIIIILIIIIIIIIIIIVQKIYHISRGRVLPPDSNPREGWKDSLGGTMSSSLKSDLSREIVLSRFNVIQILYKVYILLFL